MKKKRKLKRATFKNYEKKSSWTTTTKKKLEYRDPGYMSSDMYKMRLNITIILDTQRASGRERKVLFFFCLWFDFSLWFFFYSHILSSIVIHYDTYNRLIDWLITIDWSIYWCHHHHHYHCVCVCVTFKIFVLFHQHTHQDLQNKWSKFSLKKEKIHCCVHICVRYIGYFIDLSIKIIIFYLNLFFYYCYRRWFVFFIATKTTATSTIITMIHYDQQLVVIIDRMISSSSSLYLMVIIIYNWTSLDERTQIKNQKKIKKNYCNHSIGEKKFL